jgi:hypothetical protein
MTRAKVETDLAISHHSGSGTSEMPCIRVENQTVEHRHDEQSDHYERQ